jgi:hypothetical protein
MLKRTVLLAVIFCLLVSFTRFSPARSQTTPLETALAAVVFPTDQPPAFGVYLGHGLVLTNWHPWTLDGDFYTSDAPPLDPSRQVPQYDADGKNDPGEDLLTAADCAGNWQALAEAGPDCIPFARIEGAGFRFPGLDAAEPVPILNLVYASRQRDIALFEVDPLAVEARGVQPARLSMVPPMLRHPVTAVYQYPDGQPVTASSTIQIGTPTLLPQTDGRRLGGPWRVSSLWMSTLNPVPPGSPVFCQTTGDLLGLAWRSGDDPADTWITPASVWAHDLYAANDEIQSPALAAVLDEATSAAVDGPTTLGDPLTLGLGNGGIDVQHYDLRLNFDLENHTLDGTANLTIRATLHQLYTFSLDASGLAVEQLTVNDQPVPYVAKDQKLIIQLPDPVPFGTVFQATITYQTAPAPFHSAYLPFYEIGLFIQDKHAFAIDQPDGAHTWFPCNDHPSDRATYDFYLRVTQPFDAVANGQLVETILHEDGTQTFHWRMGYPMATYLAVVAVADYVAIEDQTPDGILLRHYVYPDKVEAGREIFSYTDDALVMLENLFGPYPYDTYGHVVVPHSGIALETQTMTIMPDDVLDLTEQDIFVLIVHELAHQWFGNTVTPATWADIWLNEGFATFSEWLALEQRYQPEASLAARSLSEQTLLGDPRSTPLIAPAPAEMLGITSYDKGAWVLHMLREQIGEETFLAVLRTYEETYRDRPADSWAFWRLAEDVSGQDLGWFFEQWLLQGGLPRYTLFWSAADTTVDTLLCSTTPGTYRLDLPLTFLTNEQTDSVTLSVEGAETRASFELAFAPTDLIVDQQQAVLAQVQARAIAELPETCTDAPQ